MYGISGLRLNDFSESNLTIELDDYLNLGVRWARFDAHWGSIETAKGVFDWSNLDWAVAECLSREIKVVLSVSYAPDWAKPGGSGSFNVPHQNAQDYADFCTALAQRFGDDIGWYELWNEQNITSFWDVPNAANYVAKVLSPGYNAIKAVSPDLRVCVGGFAPVGGYNDPLCTGTGSTDDNINPLNFLEDIYAAGGGDKFDGVAHHPYDQNVGFGYHLCSAWSQMVETPVSLRSILLANGQGHKPIIVTEYGNRAPGTVTMQVKADRIEQAFELWENFTWPKGPFCYYTYRSEHTSGNYLFDFQLVDDSYSPREPAYSAYKGSSGAQTVTGWTSLEKIFGKNTVGATLQGAMASNRKLASHFFLNEFARGEKLSGWLQNGGTSAQVFKGVVYTAVVDEQSGAFRPGTLVAVGTEVSVPTGVGVPTEFASAFPSLVDLEPGDYFLGVLRGETSMNIRGFTDVGGYQFFNDDTYADGPSSEWGTINPFQEITYSFWVTYRSNVYQVSFPSEPGKLYDNEIAMLRKPNAINLEAGEWAWENGVLYVNIGGDDPDTHTMTVFPMMLADARLTKPWAGVEGGVLGVRDLDDGWPDGGMLGDKGLTSQQWVHATPVGPVPPALSSAVVNGNLVTLAYDKTLDDNFVPPTSSFEFEVNGVPRAISGSAVVSGQTVRLSLASAVVHSDSVTYSHTPGTPPITSTDGGEAEAVVDVVVINQTPQQSGIVIPTYDIEIKPNTNDPTNLDSCQQFFWIKADSPSLPYKAPGAGIVGRVIKFAGGPDELGNEPHDEWWFLFKHMFRLAPNGANPWLLDGGSYFNFHNVGGDLGWCPPYGVSPIHLWMEGELDRHHDLKLQYNSPGTYDLPYVPIGVPFSCVMNVVFGRKDGGTARPGRVRIWINSDDGSIVTTGGPQLDTGNVNTIIKNLTGGTISCAGRSFPAGAVQEYVALWEGCAYMTPGNADASTSGYLTESACKTKSVGTIQDYIFRARHQLARIGKTFQEALADTSIEAIQLWGSTKIPQITNNYGDSNAVLSSPQWTVDDFIVPSDLAA